jgi:glucose/arabinose dehydrogenase
LIYDPRFVIHDVCSSNVSGVSCGVQQVGVGVFALVAKVPASYIDLPWELQCSYSLIINLQKTNMKIRNNLQNYLAAGSALLHTVSAANCNLKPSYAAPVVSNGWQAQLVANDLTSPRGMIFDSSGNLLVVQQGAGIVHLVFDDGGSTCLDVSKKTYLVNSTSVSGGRALKVYLLIRIAEPWNCTLC